MVGWFQANSLIFSQMQYMWDQILRSLNAIAIPSNNFEVVQNLNWIFSKFNVINIVQFYWK